MFKDLTKRLEVFLSSIIGIISGTLGVLGAMGLCCTPWIIGFLGLFGISSGMFLLTWNKWFIAGAIFFFGLSGYFFWKGRKVSKIASLKCPYCGHFQKVKVPQKGCLAFWKCEKCQRLIEAPKGECCVVCAYSDKKCPAHIPKN